jgi:hypothetical protein
MAATAVQQRISADYVFRSQRTTFIARQRMNDLSESLRIPSSPSENDPRRNSLPRKPKKSTADNRFPTQIQSAAD